MRLSPTVFSPHGIDLSYGTEYSASIVLSAAGKHRRGRKRLNQNIGMAPSGGLGLHRVTQASRVAGSGHVKTPSYVQLQLQRQRSHLLQAGKPVSLSPCLVFCALPRLQSRGIAAKLPGSTAARREQERGKRQAKMQKSENGASWLWESERRRRELVLHCKVRSRVRAEVQPCKIARRCCVVALIEGGLSWSRRVLRFALIALICPGVVRS